MKEITEKDLKRLANMPYINAQFYYTYKTEGLLKAIKTVYNIIAISIFIWSYRNVKLAKYIINKRLEKISPYMKILFEMFTCLDFHFDYEKAIQSLPEKERNDILEKLKEYEQDKNNTV